MTTHVPATDLTAYADGQLDHLLAWPVEVHLEGCAQCRERLAEVVTAPVLTMVDSARASILEKARKRPRPVRRRAWQRRAHRWGVWSLLPWALMTATAVAAAFTLDRAFPLRPSVVLLLAPVAPLAGMAMAWSRRSDPAWETVSGTARAGLELILRRTVVVLAVVLPLLATAGAFLGTEPALWLLPCLTFTAATLLLGGLIGVSRAAAVLGGGWLLAVALPALVAVHLPVLVRPQSLPGWTVAAVILTGLALLRAGDHRHLSSWN